MKILITGVCGFVGSSLARSLLEGTEGLSVWGIDNLMRPGSETNRTALRQIGVTVFHGDVRNPSDLEALPKVDWVIEAAANPSVLAGVNGSGTSRQLLENNLSGVINVLEYCKNQSAGLVLLSTSRVYSISALAALPLYGQDEAFRLDCSKSLPQGISKRGIGPGFSTAPPISLYGSTKLSSEVIAAEYGLAFGFPVWIDRCGVLAGAGQFGTPEQGIFSYWINSHLRRRSLRYLGFGGTGYQVRDAFHPRDLASLLHSQICKGSSGRQVYTVGGGTKNAMSLAQLNAWCNSRFGAFQPEKDPRRRNYDVPWVIMDSSDAETDFGWNCETSLSEILEEVARHAEQHAEWLELSGL